MRKNLTLDIAFFFFGGGYKDFSPVLFFLKKRTKLCSKFG